MYRTAIYDGIGNYTTYKKWAKGIIPPLGTEVL